MLNHDLSKIQLLLNIFLSGPKHCFDTLTPSQLEDKLAVVYAIFDKETGETLYVGRTKKLRRRLHTNHLMGPEANARLKKYLVDDPLQTSVNGMDEAKKFLKDRCYFQYIAVEDTRRRGQLEGLFSYLLDVRYIHEEH